METPKFVHLHNHSEYSLLDGMLKITDGSGHPSPFLREIALKGTNALAITDHGNMYGAMEFYFTAMQAGIKPIIGCEVYVARGKREEKNPRNENGHLTLLVKDYEGYKNLMKIVSDSFLKGFYYDPRTDLSVLEKFSRGLIVLSGCLKSEISRACLNNDLKKAESLTGFFSDVFGKENFYLELMDHGMEEEKVVLKNMLKLAKKTGTGVVATNDCHYPSPTDYEAHDAHMCIATRSFMSDSDRLKMSTNQLYFKSAEEMAKLFSHTPEAIENTVKISEKCNLKIDTDRFYLPKFDYPPEYEHDYNYLKDLCLKGLKQKMGKVPREYEERLEEELAIIRRMGFSSYFLIVMDFIKYARSSGYMVGPGRGSGAGSLVSYSLDITRIDPIKNGLLFERFLNPDRKTMPDLDIDFEVSGRDRVIDYVRKKYGEQNVASIITYGTIKAKSAIKDVGRVMGMSASEVNEITKKFPRKEKSLRAILEEEPDIRKLAQSSSETKKLFEIARKIEGLKRHTSVHAAGVVITNEPVVNYTPLSNQNRGNIVTTQYDGNMLTRLGLLKVDFLGLRTLDVISGAVRFIREKNKDFDIEKVPLDDKKTYRLLAQGKSVGVFQLESEGMRELLKALRPQTFSDISALLALYRPGPLKSGMVDEFVARKNGKKKVNYEHEILEPILKETYGTIVYQEQVMAIAKNMGGFSPGDADYLRKAMSKKNEEVMESYKEKFIKGARERQISPKLAEKIFEDIVKFAGYGFNKSHSTAYALVSYQTAYLKANYPLEFMSSLLTSEIGKNAVDVEDRENKIVTYIEDAENMGIKVLPPDVNFSFNYFCREGEGKNPAIRFALNAVKNVGDTVGEEIIAERERNGLFSSFDDFLLRMDESSRLNKKVVESLAKAGALDCFMKNEKKELFRAKILANLDKSLNSCRRNKENPAQQALFSCDSIESLIDSENGKIGQLSEHDMLKYEKEVLGMYISGHPLTKFKRHLAMISKHKIAALGAKIGAGAKVKQAGIVSFVKRIKTRKGSDMLKFELEDLTGSISVCLFPKLYKKYHHLVKSNRVLIVCGSLNESTYNGKTDFEIYADEIVELNDAFDRWGADLVVYFHDGVLFDEKRLVALKNVFSANKGMKPVYLRIKTKDGREYVAETEERVKLSCTLFEEIEKVLGEKTWLVESGY